MKRFALIVAGGSGTRMKSQVPKQFIRIGEYPVLMVTIRQFTRLAEAPQLIVVLPKAEIPVWEQLVRTYHFEIPVTIIPGGKTRAESVSNGLAALPEEPALVAIHDGVRPFITPEIIEKSYAVALEKGNAITAVPLKDSIREVQGEESTARNRAAFRLVQTPQTFQSQLIKKAYQNKTLASFTDDASVAESIGMQIHLIEGDYRNIKITTPEDLLVAEAFLQQKS